ncbi:MAG TPA: hypothetical protein VJ570_10250 [Holophagaceae bacterium]|nr:hypothetical protein [Holophagaceae bacterium]
MRLPLLLLTLPLLAQTAPRPTGGQASGRPAQGRPQLPGGPGAQGRGGGGGFRMAFDLGTSVHRLWTRNLDLSNGWSRTDPELRLIWNEELRVDSPSEAQVQALWEKQGWNLNDPRVVLVGAEDRVLATWTGEPRPEEVLSALKAGGWVSRLERLQDFLREHPDQGQARLALIQILATRARRLDPTQDAALSTANATALEAAFDRLRELPDWPQRAPGQQWGFLLRDLLNRDPAPVGADLRRRLKEDVEAEILRNPANGSLWSLWGLLATVPGDGEALVARLPKLPGQALLPPGAVQPLVEFHLRSGGCAALEALAGRVIPETTTWSADAAWRSARVAALFGQRRKEEAFRALQADLEALPDVGFMGRLMALFPLLQPAEGEDPYLTPDDRTRLFALMQEGRQAAQAKAKAKRMDEDEETPVLRLEVAGSPAWAKGWADLPKHPAFDDWGPSELAFGLLDGKAWAALRERKGWGSEPRWILRKGDDFFASGTEAPTPQALADAVRQQGEPRLAQLRKALKEHPDLVAARRMRLQTLRDRMPHPRLEALLLEDAQKLAEPFLAEDFTPLPDLWRSPARRKAAELEGAIARWPQDTEAWLAWLDWSKVAGQGDAAALLQQLPLPPVEVGEEGPLPTNLGATVAGHLQTQERLKELAAFGRPFWEALKPRLTQAAHAAEGFRPGPGGARTATLAGTPAEGAKGPSPEDMARRIQGQVALGQIRAAMGLLRPWTEALRATRQGPEADAVIAALEEIQPGLGQRLSGNGSNGGRRNAPAPAAPTAPSTPARPVPAPPLR